MPLRVVTEIQRAAIEMQQRGKEPLDLWEPLPVQADFHASLARERVFMAANQCLTELTRIDTPDGKFTIGHLFDAQEPFRVWSMKDGKRIATLASAPFLRNVAECYRVVLSDGQWFECSGEHRVLSASGEWVGIVSLVLDSHPDSCPFFGCDQKIRSVRGIGIEGVYDFAVPETNTYLLAGVTHHNCGKTQSACVEDAMFFCGRHPRLPKKNGKAFIVARDGKEVGDVLYNKLFRPGSFRIIKDLSTGLWRAYKWWEEPDREKESIDAPPLIPARYIKSIAWENKKGNIPAVITSVTGTEFRFLTSQGKPPHGVQLDLAHFDEEIVDPEWYTETMARLIFKGGLFIWSVTPQVGTQRLYTLYENAQRMEAEGTPDPRIEFFYMEFDDNPYITPKKRADFKAQIEDEHEYLARIKGKPVILGLRVFPEFDFRQAQMVQPWREIPQSWTRYAFIDPGHQLTAVLFAAVPPPMELKGDFIYLYDELYLKNCTAAILAKEMAKKCLTQEFQDFIIDYQGARVRDAGQGRTIIEQYAEAFAKLNVSSRNSGCNFTHGGADVEAGVMAAKELLEVREDGTTKLRYFGRKQLPNWTWEIEHWNNQRDKATNKPTNKPESRGRVHQMACFRYCALYRPQYVRPEAVSNRRGGYRQWLQKLDMRDKMAAGSKHVNLGPGERLIDV